MFKKSPKKTDSPPTQENDDLDSEEIADEELKDDIANVEALIIKARAGGSPNDNLQVALKASQLADLYFEALEEISDMFIHYKEVAAEYYQKVGKMSGMQDSDILGVLMYLQANMVDKARHLLNKTKTIQKKGKGFISPDEIVVSVCQEIITNNVTEAEKKVKDVFYVLNEDIKNEVLRTFKYMSAFKRK